ncbi:MAG: tetratricopeptide repeat protein [Acidobacteria bacterium]|nr:tetratricopeptide repeat protein [Acidobacteriota bacterium]
MNEGFRLLAEVPAPDPPVLTALGLVLLRKNAPAEAIRLFEQAVRLEPSQARHHLNLAIALKQAGQSAKARESLERARALDPHLPIP